ncbi:MAG TPA: hypothetical protein VED86_03535 [archaeon]|nr:hypothetical protein [archaeon]
MDKCATLSHGISHSPQLLTIIQVTQRRIASLTTAGAQGIRLDFLKKTEEASDTTASAITVSHCETEVARCPRCHDREPNY